MNLSFEKVCWPHTLVFYLCPQSSEARGLVIKDGFLFVCFISGLFPLTSGPLVCHLVCMCVHSEYANPPSKWEGKHSEELSAVALTSIPSPGQHGHRLSIIHGI